MEENQSSTTNQSSGGNSKKWIMIAVAAIIIISIAVIAGGGFYFLNSSEEDGDGTMTNHEDAFTEDEFSDGHSTDDAMMEGDDGDVMMEKEDGETGYVDGEYSATGTYSYHSDTESIDVTLTLESGVITEVEVISLGKAPISKKMQADFIANYESEVVGVDIDDVKLGKVSGSSLTGIGFNAAVEDIKAQAQS